MQLQKNARVSSVANLVKLVSRCLVLVSAAQQVCWPRISEWSPWLHCSLMDSSKKSTSRLW